MIHRVRIITAVLGLGLVVLGCGSGTETSAPASREAETPTETSAPPERTTTSTQAPDGPPELVEISIFPPPSWANDAIAAASGSILNVEIIPSDVAPGEVRAVFVRPFADATAESLDAFESDLRELGVVADFSIFTCPFSAEDFTVVDDYLRSFEWSATGGQDLTSPRFAPSAAPFGRHGWGHCLILFPLERVSAEEVETISQVALARNVGWIDFWAGSVTEEEGDPLGEPVGGFPSIKVPAACDPAGCTGPESN